MAGAFLLACNFTDARLLGLNSLRFSRLRIDRGWAYPYSPSLKRPCHGTSGLVRGNRRKAVFAFKGCFPKDICHVFDLGQRIYIAYFGSAGKNRKSPSASRFSATKPQVAEAQNRGLVGRSRFYPALPESPNGSMQQIPEPLNAIAFSRKRIAGRRTAAIRCDWPVIPADIVLVLFSCYSSFTAEVKLW